MKLIKLKAQNVYSFDKVEVQLDAHELVQVTGRNLDEQRRVNLVEDTEAPENVNGIGKSNLFNCIIQAMYSRDIYKTKKSYLKNMFTKSKFLIELDLEIEDILYKVSYTADECILYKNGEQFLSGRASVTEFFEDLIPFELFLPLTYISSNVNFPFFTATSSQQKQFIELVFSDLNKFKDAIPKLKEKLANITKEKIKIETETNLLEKQADVVLEAKKELPELPEFDDFSTEIKDLENRIERLKSIEREVNSLNKKLEVELKVVQEPTEDIAELQERLGKGKALIAVTNTEIAKLKKVSEDSVCSVCGSEIDVVTNQQLLKEKTQYQEKLEGTLATVRSAIKTNTAQEEEYKKYEQKVGQRRVLQDQLQNLYFDEQEYNNNCASLVKLKDAQAKQKIAVKEIQELRETAIAHNTKVESDTQAKQKAIIRLAELEQETLELESMTNSLKLLIEICDKVIVSKQIPKRLEVLERFINIELANFTSQYKVVLEMKNNKIKPSIIKDGKTYAVENLSTGERARLNISLIFAIRTILSKLRKEIYNINLLYIDELVAILDYSGKHLLINTLKKFNLNIFLVSHDYIFPDVQLINLVKQNNRTRIEE